MTFATVAYVSYAQFTSSQSVVSFAQSFPELKNERPQTLLLSTSNINFNHTIIDNSGPKNIWQKTVGDINNDGLIDLIAGGNSSGGLVWYKNPSWQKNIINNSPGHSTDGEVADIDRDGDNDVVSITTSQIRWYENPDWTIHNIEDRKLHDLEVADFDGDGDIDIVARDQAEFGHQGNELHFYRQNSPSSWTHSSITIPNGEGLLVVDIDGDKDQDVVVNGRWLENTGDITNGPWTEHIFTSSWTHRNTFISAGDINRDGRLDIALAPAELAGQTYHISWFEAPLNPKDSNWVEHIVDNNVEAVHHFIGVADMNNDGNMDIATAEMVQGNDPDEVKIYVNSGGGVSWTKQVLATTGSHSMRVVDFDNDNDMDLFGANWQGQNVELWKNLTCQQSILDTWERHVIDSERPWRAIFIDSADVDGDFQQDIITGGWWYKNPGSPAGSWTRNIIGSPLNNMAAVFDFDGDGHMDILGTKGQGSQTNASFVWAHNNGSGVFTVLNNIEAGDGDFLQGVAVDRFQDGDNIAAALSWHTANKGIQHLTVPSNPLSETWSHTQVSPDSQDEALSAGDIDGDNDIDLLLGTKWLRNDETSWSTHTVNDTDGNPDRNRLADINMDGRLDAVVGFEAISVSGKLAWYEQPSTAISTWTEHIIANIIGPMSLDVADMDHDGDVDVVVGEHNLSDPSSAKLYVFENVDGHGNSWTEHIVYTGDEHHDGAQVVDIDNDGDLDIISIGWSHNQVLLYENKAPLCQNKNADFSNITYIPLITSSSQ